MKNLYDCGILFCYFRIQRKNENVLILKFNYSNYPFNVLNCFYEPFYNWLIYRFKVQTQVHII
jgi:hypothetical protein